MEKYAKFKVEDFASDSDFITWVQTPNEVSKNFWNRVISKHPHQKENIQKAVFLIQSLEVNENVISDERKEFLWYKIREKTYSRRKGNRFSYLRWAAIFVILVGLGSVIARYSKTSEFQIAETEIANITEAQVILADGSTKSINQKDFEIEVKTNGEILVDNDTLVAIRPETAKAELNHVVMPYGKQAKLKLPDGSIVYINSGSKLSFPAQFEGNKREIYLVGEAYLKVESDKQKPFIVHTPDMDVTVTGTEFNVSAYSDDDFVQTVLVEGKVSLRKAGLFSKKVEIVPGEGALFYKQTGEVTTETVETSQHTSWINGYLNCNNEPIAGVVRKLERYYNCKIVIEQNVSAITFSGKLDLNEDVSKVLETISYASLLKLEQDGKEFSIKK